VTPANFPARQQRRRDRAVMPKGAKVEPPVDPDAREVRTKKLRKGRRK
jgi:hypothetical protein